jgi:hypothetical protein
VSDLNADGIPELLMLKEDNILSPIGYYTYAKEKIVKIQ